MSAVVPAATGLPDLERRLYALGLSTELIHDSFRPGLTRSRNRSQLAAKTTPGTDVYHDTFEALANRLTPDGWTREDPDGQPRITHPKRLLTVTLASAKDVTAADPRVRPRTRHKGRATVMSLDRSVGLRQPTLDIPEFKIKMAAAPDAPLWFLLYERTEMGLDLCLARPATQNKSGEIIGWSDIIPVAPLVHVEDLSIFGDPNEDESSGFDVPVIPR